MKLPTLSFCPHRRRPMPVRIDAKSCSQTGLRTAFIAKFPCPRKGWGRRTNAGPTLDAKKPPPARGASGGIGATQMRWEGGVWPSGGLAVLREKCRCGAAELLAAHSIEAARVHPLRELATDQVIGAPAG